MFLKFVEHYIDNNMSVIPLRRENRLPLDEGWTRFCHKKITAEDVDIYISQFGHDLINNASLGLCLGPASNVVAIDFDYSENDSAEFEEAILQIIPPSPVRKKGSRGWTNFYKYNPDIKLEHFSRKVIGKDDKEKMVGFVDVLSTGSQTVLPPSYHDRIKSNYVWLTTDTLEDFSADDLPLINSDMIAKIKYLAEVNKEDIKDFFHESGRHCTVAKKSFARMEWFKSYDQAVDFMIEYDLEKHPDNPYFEDTKYFLNKPIRKEVLAILKRLEKSVINAKKNRGLKWEGIGTEIELTEELNTVQDFIKLSGDDGYYNKIEDQNGTRFVPDYRLFADMTKLSNMFLFNDSYELMYQDNFWQSKEDSYIRNMVSQCNSRHWKVGHIDQFLKSARITCVEHCLNFQDTKNKINIANGVLDFKENKLYPSSNKFLFKYKIPIKYDSEAKCTRWDKFLDETFEGDKQLIDLVQDLFGYTIMGDNPFLHRVFILYGDGRNGKSTMLDVLKDLIGYENFSAVSMADIHKPFSAVMLDGKLANIVGETSIDNISNEAVKAIAAGEPIIAANKGKDEYKFNPTARLIFACNNLPKFGDNSVGILDRLVFIPFDRYLKTSERDTLIGQKLKAEYSGILNWAIVGLKRVLDTRKIHSALKSDEVKEDYRRSSNKIYDWFLHKITYTHLDSDFIPTDTLFDNYTDWCHKQKHHYTHSKIGFSKEVCRILKEKSDGEIKSEQVKKDSKNFRGYRRIVFTENIAEKYSIPRPDLDKIAIFNPKVY